MIIKIDKNNSEFKFIDNGIFNKSTDELHVKNEVFEIYYRGLILNDISETKNYFLKNGIEKFTNYYPHVKGSYFGYLKDFRKNNIVFFCDPISTKPLYYYDAQNELIVSDSYSDLLLLLKNKNYKLTINEYGCYLMLTYAYCFEEVTMCNEIKRLKVGEFLELKDKSLSTYQIFRFTTSSDNSIKMVDAIEIVDKYFSKAITQSFNHDKKKKLNHLASLSGGLDSRMTVIVANKLGFNKQTNITFSESDYLDEKIPKRIARDFKHEWIYKSLDNGLFLKNIDETTRISGGNVLYYGLSHANSLYKKLNFDKFGILHTGQFGDTTITPNTRSSNQLEFKIGDGAYSTLLIDRLNSFSTNLDYENQEIFNLYIRGCYGINQGLFSIQKYTETYSPFYDVDFLQKTLSIPLPLRFGYKLYFDWIRKKHPQAAKYVWEKTGCSINNRFYFFIGKTRVYFKNIPILVLRKSGLLPDGFDHRNNMNPIGYWIKTNTGLSEFFKKYFQENIKLISNPEIKKDCIFLFEKGNSSEKIQALSLVSSFKLILE